jgi:hypothetical protein
MPARSKKQRAYLYHKFGKAWVKKHHFTKVVPKRKKKRK